MQGKMYHLKIELEKKEEDFKQLLQYISGEASLLRRESLHIV